MLNPSELPDAKNANSLILFDEDPSNIKPNDHDINAAGTGSIWTVSNGTKNPSRASTANVKDSDDEKNESGNESNGSDDEDDDDESVPDTKIIFDKEFEDYYEDRIHKSGSSMIFLSKTLGLLPVIWTEEDLEGEFKTYLNFYTFILYTCWLALFIITLIKLVALEIGPEDKAFEHYVNGTKNGAYLFSVTALQTNLIGQWLSSIVIVSCGIFNSRVLADVFYSLSGVDYLLNVKEKQYAKINRKTIGWCIFYLFLWGGHGVAIYYLLNHSKMWHLLYFFSDVASYGIPIALDLQLIFLCLSLRKRYRVLSKQLHEKTKAWKLRKFSNKKSNVLQNILQHRFDQIFEPKDEELMKTSMEKPNITFDPWLKDDPNNIGSGMKLVDAMEVRPSKEEESELIAQLETLRCAYIDLGNVIVETNNMFSASLCAHIIATSISFILWLYLNMFSMEYFKIFYAFVGLCLLSVVRIFLICYHAHKLKHESRKPVAEACQIATVDGSAKLERLLVKTASQMYYNQPILSCGDYFPLGQKTFFLILSISIIIAYLLCRIHGFEFNSMKEVSELGKILTGIEVLKAEKKPK